MAVQDTDSVTVQQAKAQLLELASQWEAEKKAKGPMGTWRGKAVVGAAVGAVAAGWLASGAAKRLMGARRQQPAASFGNWRSRGAKWRPRDTKDVKKAAVGGISLGLVMQLLRPLLPHLAQYAGRRYASWRVAKAQAAHRNGSVAGGRATGL